MKRCTGLLIIAALLMAPGCSDTPVQPVDDPVAADPGPPFTPAVRNEVDILWVIDDSFAMRPFQTRLAQDFPVLAARLGDPTLNADFNMAVVTVNRGKFTFRDGPEPRELDVRTDLDHCRDSPREPVLSASAYRDRDTGELDLERLQEDFTCIAAVGEDNTSSTEYGLETMRMALDATDSENAGFLRDGALLVVIFVTDEDDCSQPELPQPIQASSCYMRARYGELTDVGEYESALLTLKGADLDQPESVQAARQRILVLGLIGPPVVSGVLAPTLIDTPMEVVDTTCSGLFSDLAGLPSSCTTDADCGVAGPAALNACSPQGECSLPVSANSSYRYWDLMRRFVPSYNPFEEDNGHPTPPGVEFWDDDPIRFVAPSNEQPWGAICDSDYTPALRALADQIAGAFDINCILSPPRTCERDSDCGRGVACILDQSQYAQCPINGLCEDFAVNIEVFRDGGYQSIEGAVTAQQYCQLYTEARVQGIEASSTGGYRPPEGAQFWVNYAANCPYDIGFGFTSGNQPRDDDRFRLRYPVSISDDF